MKKTLIAAAVLAGLAGVAHAESSVTLYGTLDGGLHYSKQVFKNKVKSSKTSVSKFGITQGVQSDNKFGLQGSEDLGNGVSALFKLEGGFNITDGTSDGALFGKKAYLGLSSDAFGTLTAGLQGNAVDELAPDDGSWANFDFFGHIGGTKVAPGVKYVSPDLQGFQFATSWAGTNKTNKTTGAKTTKEHSNSLALGLAYSYGSLNLNAGVARTNDTSKKVKPTSFILGANYDFGPVAVFARYGHANTLGGASLDLSDDLGTYASGTNAITGVTEDTAIKVNVAALALSAPVTATGTVYANYQHAWGKDKVANLKVRADAFNAAYVENLSKSTSVYVYGGYKTEKLKSAFTSKRTELALGLTHKF